MSKSEKEQDFSSAVEARRVIHYSLDDNEVKKAKRYLKYVADVKQKRQVVIMRAKMRLGSYSSALHVATESWEVLDALVALRDRYAMSVAMKDRKIHWRCIRHIRRLNKHLT